MITTLVCAERFFGGFKEAIGNMVTKENRLETYRVSIVLLRRVLMLGLHLYSGLEGTYIVLKLRYYH